jgi:CubicO group peptidase (beta-lactamase class C family)
MEVNGINTKLERARPEEYGVSPTAVIRFLKAMEDTGFTAHNIILVKSGKVVFEIHYNPFKPHIRHMLCSCSKSVAATAVGFALHEGLLSLNERITDIFPDKLNGETHPYIQAMTVKHLLTMTTAYSEALEPQTKDWTREFLNGSPDTYPGTLFSYDSIGTHVLCEAVQKRSGFSVQEYLTPRLFEPLGIQPHEILWEKNPGGVNHGGGGLHLTPEAMAKFGLVYLNGGLYKGRQVLPPGWAGEAAKGRVNCVTCDGSYKNAYGYKFWRVQDNGYAALGLAGQSIVMHPDKDLVFVATANGFQTDYHYFHKTFFWQFLYPTISHQPIPYEEAAYSELTAYVQRAEAFLPRGASRSPYAKTINNRVFETEPNKAGIKCFSFTLNSQGGVLTLQINEQNISIPFGYHTHVPGPIGLQGFAKQSGDEYPHSSAAAGVWASDDTLVLRSHVIDTLQYFTVTCHFGSEATALEIKPYGIYTYDIFPIVVNALALRYNM